MTVALKKRIWTVVQGRQRSAAINIAYVHPYMNRKRDMMVKIFRKIDVGDVIWIKVQVIK